MSRLVKDTLQLSLASLFLRNLPPFLSCLPPSLLLVVARVCPRSPLLLVRSLAVPVSSFSVRFASRAKTKRGTAVYTSSWVAPKADVHSQQRFFYMGQKGEINVDQAHRGYTVAKDGDGFRSVNPLFMKYTPTDGERKKTGKKRKARYWCLS